MPYKCLFLSDLKYRSHLAASSVYYTGPDPQLKTVVVHMFGQGITLCATYEPKEKIAPGVANMVNRRKTRFNFHYERSEIMCHLVNKKLPAKLLTLGFYSNMH